jgi:uncharacterized protein (DUF58 family)
MATDERSLRWRVVVGCSLLLAAVGVWTVRPVLLVAAIVPFVFVAVSALTSAPRADHGIGFERTVVPQQVYPGGLVDVELDVENTSDQPLSDLRVVDGVPAELPVVDGSPRAALSLAPGETATIAYTVRARYGDFEFTPVTARTHSLSGASTYTTTLAADGDCLLSGGIDVDEYPMARQTTGITGQLTTDRGGDGIEFHRLREHQPGDPMHRIDWHHYAKERTLSTIEYRREEAVEVVVVVDSRRAAGVAGAETAPTGTELCVYAAAKLVEGLLTTRNRVGLVALGIDDPERAGDLAWVAPGTDRGTRTQIWRLLDAAGATVSPGAEGAERRRSGTDLSDESGPGSDRSDQDESPGDRNEEAAGGAVAPLEIVERLNPQTQVLVLSPLSDDYPTELVRQLTTTGHAVTVYSPDVTNRATSGGRLTTVERMLRMTELRNLGVSVVDWDPDEPLAAAFDRQLTTSTTSIMES